MYIRMMTNDEQTHDLSGRARRFLRVEIKEIMAMGLQEGISFSVVVESFHVGTGVKTSLIFFFPPLFFCFLSSSCIRLHCTFSIMTRAHSSRM